MFGAFIQIVAILPMMSGAFTVMSPTVHSHRHPGVIYFNRVYLRSKKSNESEISFFKDFKNNLFVFRNPKNEDLCVLYGSEARDALLGGGWQQLDTPVLSSNEEVEKMLRESEREREALTNSKDQSKNEELDLELQQALMEFYKSEEERSKTLESLVKRGASISRTNSMMRVAVDTKFGARNLKILLKLGGSVHDIDAFGSTPLHIASLFCNSDVIDILLEEGADLEAKDNDGLTPKMVFAKTVENNQMLELEYGTASPPEQRKSQERIQALFAE
jgi:hypothetical protein